jgi:hypothetical protein
VLQLVLISFKNFKCFGSDAATIGVFENHLLKDELLRQVGIIQPLEKKRTKQDYMLKV